jgi:hypothetical protein
MLPTIVFGLALLFTWIVIITNVNAMINKAEATNLVYLVLIIAIVLWSYLFYLLH